jgi:long-chain acyl-CoA synthetase
LFQTRKKQSSGQHQTVRNHNPNFILEKPTDPASIAVDKEFKAMIMEELNNIGTANKLSGLEKPKDIAITFEPFSIENNLLTPTFKLKRNIARDHFKALIDSMYVELVKKGL